MKMRVHIHINIQGVLDKCKKKKINFFSDENGNDLSDKEARDYLNECLQKGWRVIPCCKSEECPHFDYQTGCPGHHEET